MIERDGRYLLIRRGAATRAAGWWCLPGGAIGRDENERDALVREIGEELGIRVEPRRALWRATTAWGIDLVWWETAWDEAPGNDVLRPAPAEVAATAWLTRAEALAMDRLLGSNVGFFQALP